jgi:NMD protein affecting ribosome stability and mRNA decay
MDPRLCPRCDRELNADETDWLCDACIEAEFEEQELETTDGE